MSYTLTVDRKCEYAVVLIQWVNVSYTYGIRLTRNVFFSCVHCGLTALVDIHTQMQWPKDTLRPETLTLVSVHRHKLHLILAVCEIVCGHEHKVCFQPVYLHRKGCHYCAQWLISMHSNESGSVPLLPAFWCKTPTGSFSNVGLGFSFQSEVFSLQKATRSNPLGAGKMFNCCILDFKLWDNCLQIRGKINHSEFVASPKVWMFCSKWYKRYVKFKIKIKKYIH